jgi:hypothetical protein
VENLRAAGWDVSWFDEVLQQVIWSAAVHYGPQYLPELFTEALGLSPAGAFETMEEFIKAIYQVRSLSRNANDWISTRNSAEIVYGLRNRMVNECADAVAML